MINLYVLKLEYNETPYIDYDNLPMYNYSERKNQPVDSVM